MISFIVPCKNEEEYIPICLDALLALMEEKAKIEIIVIDNGSKDKTVDILNNYKSKIKQYSLPNATISELRNYGAKKGKGEWLAFIDADVKVDAAWYNSFLEFIEKKRENIDVTKILTGSTCDIPEDSSWIERIWFHQLLMRDKASNEYVNSGNLIIHRNLFFNIGGFDHFFETGEDEKLCYDAKLYGGKVIKESSLKAIHYGYPKSIGLFFRRERWHGIGMAKYITKPWKYRDLLLAYYNWLIIFLFIIWFVFNPITFEAFTSLLFMLILPLFCFSLMRANGNYSIVLPLTFLYFIYGFAKMIALIDILCLRKVRIL